MTPSGASNNEANVPVQRDSPKGEKLSESTARPSPLAHSIATEPNPWLYATNSGLKLNILATTNFGKIVSAKAVDGTGAVKWTENYSYDADSKKFVEMRRIKSDGTVIQVLYKYSGDGTQTRIVIGPDGNMVPPNEQEAFLRRD